MKYLTLILILILSQNTFAKQKEPRDWCPCEGVLKIKKHAKDPLVQYEIFVCMIKAKFPGCKKKTLKALEHLKFSAEKGYAPAQYSMAMKSLWDHKKQDKKAAFNWLKKSANGAYLPAVIKLAEAYERGLVKKDSKLAKKWFQLAEALALRSAKKKNTDAYLQLGKFYLKGNLGIKKDKTKAKKYLSLAADAGNQQAKYILGLK